MANKTYSAARGLRDAILEMEPLQFCLFVAIPFVLAFSTANLSLGFEALGRIELSIAFALLVLLAWVKKKGSSLLAENLFIFQTAALFGLLYFYAGLSDIGFIWSFGFPFIACLIAGARFGFVWAIMYMAAIAICSYFFGEYTWQKTTYIGLAYLAFSCIAYFSLMSKENREQAREAMLRNARLQMRHDKKAIVESEINHRVLLDALPHAIFVHRDGHWVFCNLAAAQLLGASRAESIIGLSVFNFIHADFHRKSIDRIRQMTKTGNPAPETEVKLLRKNGDVFDAHIQSSPVVLSGKPAFLMLAEDISDRNQQDEERHLLKSQREHSQRLESLGVLAGGIAHDFNNLLAAIMGNAELARGYVGGAGADMDRLDQFLNNIEESCDHASELCKQMLAYAGKGSYEMEVLDINDMVRSMGKLIRASVSSNINLKIKLDEDLPGFEGDMAQMHQLVLNFIVNSAEAIGTAAGEIKVTTGSKYLKHDLLNLLYNGSALKEGQYVVIEVKDNGCGMDKALQARIFDPFFTTKKTGSGLGLSAVLGIVRGHQGGIQLFSARNKGTAFRIFLPATGKTMKEIEVSTMMIEAWQGEGAVLIVDDDQRVRTVAQAFVEKLGFDVITAEDGKEGVEKFCHQHEELVAVLLDMTMPVMGGLEAMAGMRKCDPTVPIILVSGYSEVEAGHLLAGDRPDAFLQKPFKAKNLNKILHSVIEKA
jgi:PAS domain S-box-containing protein